jgi:SAM-dependent methyltransferase
MKPILDERSSGAAGDEEGYVDWKAWAPEQFGVYSALDAAYFRDEVGLRDGARQRVLEIGFGNGAFLSWARDEGADTYGMETNPLLVARASELLGPGHAYNDLHAAGLDALEGTFTRIVGFDVLEHIEQRDYPRLFARFSRLLQPGGKCVLRYPNGDSPFGRRVQHGDPTHVTAIGSEKLAYYSRRAGFGLEAIRAPALPTSGVGWRRSSKRRVVLALRFGMESFLGLLYYGRRVHLDENSTAVLTRL